jgi:hypothetical protein
MQSHLKYLHTIMTFFYFDKSYFSISCGYPVEYQKTAEDQPFLWLVLMEIP